MSTNHLSYPLFYLKMYFYIFQFQFIQKYYSFKQKIFYRFHLIRLKNLKNLKHRLIFNQKKNYFIFLLSRWKVTAILWKATISHDHLKDH